MNWNIAFLAEGDANSGECWSGSGRSFVAALRRAGVNVYTINTELSGVAGRVAAAAAFHPDRKRWRQRFRLGGAASRLRSWRAAAAIRAIRHPIDAVIQVGATFRLPPSALGRVPYIAYCDSNIAYALKGRPFSGATHLAESMIPGVVAREQALYDSVDRIWTMSRALARSFQADFGQPDSKLLTIYAGPNHPAPGNPPPPPNLPPSVLFVGKDHARKGSDILLRAFAQVREVIPNAELHIVGANPPGSDAPGVTAHGFLSRELGSEQRRIDQLFEQATVFCMPSRYEPFGIAFVEAMLAGKPCIGTDGWAMPEIIADGETGWLVPDGSVEVLSATLVRALSDRETSARFGLAGRKRALSLFTWDLTAGRAVTDLEHLIAQKQ